MSRRGVILGLVAIGAGIIAPQAGAAQRYASQGGVGTACSQAAPCSIVEAMSGSSSGDTINVAAGNYAVSGGSIAGIRDNLTIQGPATGPKPSISAVNGNALYVIGDGVVIRDLALSASGTGQPVAISVFGASLVERVRAFSSGNQGAACVVVGATIRDSVCETTGADAFALIARSDGTVTSYARNVTAISRGAGSTGASAFSTTTAAVTLNARNVIAKGGLDDVSAITDGNGGTATVTLGTSLYNTVFAQAGGSVTPAGAAGNISVAPVFVNGPASDFRQLASSPTVNAGSTDSRTGTTDLDGEARPQGSAIDIGADELPEATAPPVDLEAPETTFISGPPRKSRSKRARLDFTSSEPGSTFECALDGKAFRPCVAPVLLRKLKPRRHIYEVRAIDANGNVDTSPAAYRWRVVKRKR